MIRIGIVGDIGSGKSHLARLFGYPVFNADVEVAKLYKKNKKCYLKLKKILPNYVKSFPVKKKEISKAILKNSGNLKKIVRIIHPMVRKSMNLFLKKNKNNKFVVLDIPLLLENKLNKKKDIIIFIDAKKKDINKKLKKKYNNNLKIVKRMRKFQLPIEVKRKRSDFTIKNNFKNKSAKINVKKVMKFF